MIVLVLVNIISTSHPNQGERQERREGGKEERGRKEKMEECRMGRKEGEKKKGRKLQRNVSICGGSE